MFSDCSIVFTSSECSDEMMKTGENNGEKNGTLRNNRSPARIRCSLGHLTRR